MALPDGSTPPPEGLPGQAHEARTGTADLDGYVASGLPARTMGRSLEQDELFFRSALAGGSVLGDEAVAAGAPFAGSGGR